MHASKAVLILVREWIEMADHDLTAAAAILKLGKTAPKETVCFHAQQCVEKYLKAVLVYRSIPFSKTHDIRALMGLVPRRYHPTLDDAMRLRLTRYAAPSRYPRSGVNISWTAMRRAVTAARRVRREGRRKLPKAALPKKSK